MALADASFQLELVGARLLGPAPIRDVYFEFNRGVHAFYGKNGAGKSRLLYALADLVEGRVSDSDGYLVARVRTHGVPHSDDDSPSFSGLTVSPAFREEVPEGKRPWAQAGDVWRSFLGDLLWPTCFAVSGRPRFAGRVFSLDDEESDLYAALDDWDELDEDAQGDLIEAIDERQSESEPTYEWPVARGIIEETIHEIVLCDLVALTPGAEGWLMAPAVMPSSSRPRLAEAFEQIAAVAAKVSSGDSVTVAASRERLDHLNNLIVVLTPLFDLVRDDGTADDFLSEAARLLPTDPCPIRLGLGDAFNGLKFSWDMQGQDARTIRDDTISLALLHERTRDGLFVTSADEDWPLLKDDDVSPELHSRGAALAERASDLFRTLLADAPPLHLEFTAPELWFVDPPISWMFGEPERALPLANASQAQLRWATLSVAGAIYDLAGSPRDEESGRRLPAQPFEMWFLDEPDAALHATAERHAVNGLVAAATEANAMIVVATHSQAFLNHGGVMPHHVGRAADGCVTAHPLGAVQRQRVADLGLTPADLLLLTRLVLVVEGAHDQIVIDALVGDQLAELGVLTMPMRGGRLLATVVDSHLLAYFADVPVVAALDNLVAPKIQRYWEDLVAAQDGGNVAFDLTTKKHFSSSRRDEEGFLINYCRSAAELGQIARFHVFGFSERDIQEYLPCRFFVPGATWLELRAGFERQKAIPSFKPWLQQVYGIEITELLLRDAADAMDEIPDDFVRLVETCSELLRR
jgi:energy-coupling factor transporter ATP-binding protein EcfA2